MVLLSISTQTVLFAVAALGFLAFLAYWLLSVNKEPDPLKPTAGQEIKKKTTQNSLADNKRAVSKPNALKKGDGWIIVDIVDNHHRPPLPCDSEACEAGTIDRTANTGSIGGVAENQFIFLTINGTKLCFQFIDGKMEFKGFCGETMMTTQNNPPNLSILDANGEVLYTLHVNYIESADTYVFSLECLGSPSSCEIQTICKVPI